MSDVVKDSPSPASPSSSSSCAAAVTAAAACAALPGSERPDYRGKCLYKTGKCLNERALKTSGTAHNLCDEHRNRQNQHQRKLDAKNRLHKRERRASAGTTRSPKSERFAPYPTTAAAKRPTAVNTSDEADSAVENVTVAAIPPPLTAAVVTATVEEDGATSSPSAAQSSVLATTSNGAMFLPNGPQPPQVSYPFVMQDFDGIVVPLPSYLEGQERVEFRSRIYQKVLDFISEECILRFGAKVEPVSAENVAPDSSGATQTGFEIEHQASNNEDNLSASSDDNDTLDAPQQSSTSVTKESRTSTTKKVH